MSTVTSSQSVAEPVAGISHGHQDITQEHGTRIAALESTIAMLQADNSLMEARLLTLEARLASAGI